MLGGLDPLVLRVGLDERTGLSLHEAHEAPTSVLLTLDALIDAWDRIEDRRVLLSAMEAALEANRRKRGR